MNQVGQMLKYVRWHHSFRGIAPIWFMWACACWHKQSNKWCTIIKMKNKVQVQFICLYPPKTKSLSMLGDTIASEGKQQFDLCGHVLAEKSKAIDGEQSSIWKTRCMCNSLVSTLLKQNHSIIIIWHAVTLNCTLTQLLKSYESIVTSRRARNVNVVNWFERSPTSTTPRTSNMSHHFKLLCSLCWCDILTVSLL